MPIDLRSDTVTKPTDAMREAMAQADVGDDVYGEDPTVNRLQETVAELLGKEAALFVPSGTMGNQLAIKAHTQAGDEVLVDAESHIFHYETAAPSVISNVQLHCFQSDWGQLYDAHIEALGSAVRPSTYYFPHTRLLCLEQTHNRYGGAVLEQQTFRRAEAFARSRGLALHCDGARLWNACAASSISPREYAEHVDTVSVCLSKGLGAPIGSVLAGSRKQMDIAHKWRKILGGGMRQVGVLAAAGLYALEHHLPLLHNDHIHAINVARTLAASGLVNVDIARVQTNIVVFALAETVMGACSMEQLVQGCAERGVLIASIKQGVARAVLHHQVSTAEADEAAATIVHVLQHYAERSDPEHSDRERSASSNH
jgi:threonine aldolase